jgi:hypothetical protein
VYSLIEMRDRLIEELSDQAGVLSVGIASRGGQLVLLVAVDESLREGTIPERFEGVRVVVEDLGRAESQISQGRNVNGF